MFALTHFPVIVNRVLGRCRLNHRSVIFENRTTQYVDYLNLNILIGDLPALLSISPVCPCDQSIWITKLYREQPSFILQTLIKAEFDLSIIVIAGMASSTFSENVNLSDWLFIANYVDPHKSHSIWLFRESISLYLTTRFVAVGVSSPEAYGTRKHNYFSSTHVEMLIGGRKNNWTFLPPKTAFLIAHRWLVDSNRLGIELEIEFTTWQRGESSGKLGNNANTLCMPFTHGFDRLTSAASLTFPVHISPFTGINWLFSLFHYQRFLSGFIELWSFETVCLSPAG